VVSEQEDDGERVSARQLRGLFFLLCRRLDELFLPGLLGKPDPGLGHVQQDRLVDGIGTVVSQPHALASHPLVMVFLLHATRSSAVPADCVNSLGLLRFLQSKMSAAGIQNGAGGHVPDLAE